MNNKYRPKQTDDKLTVEYEKEDFETALPNIASEINKKNETSTLKIDSLIHDHPSTIPDPQVEDFLQRCKSDEEGNEIINYMLKRGEITTRMAQKLLKIIRKDGIRSFGPLRENGFYEKTYGGN